jgi:hypothetical protein
MFFSGTGRFGHRRIAHLVIALAVVACRKQEVSRPVDAPPIDAVPIDAPADAADAAAKPAPVATQLVASGDSTCAVMSDLTLRCWGGNEHGQLGNGQTGDAATPVVPEIRAVKELQLVDGTVCALLDDASVACWGRIAWHGHTEDILRPTGVLGVIGVTKLFVLAGRACARVADDSLVCWGNIDARGHLVPRATNRLPTPVVGLDHVAGLTLDGAFSDDGRWWRWGSDGVPKLVEDSGVQEIADRDGTVCGRLQTGRVMCAPSDRCGAHHTSSPPSPKPDAPKRGKPTRAKTTSRSGKAVMSAKAPKPDESTSSGTASGGSSEGLGFPSVRQLAFGLGFCVVTTTDKLTCDDGCGRIKPPTLDRVSAVVGRCAQGTSGAVTCFDDGKPTAIPGITHPTQLAVGRAHACALAAGKIVCWGNRDHGQLGDFALSP